MRLNPAKIYRLHRLLGLIIALPLLIMILSGLVLVFLDQIRDFDTDYRLSAPAADMMSAAQLQRSIELNWPNARLTRLYLPKNYHYSVKAVLREDRVKHTVFLHPQTGRLIRQLDADRMSFTTWLYNLHRGKFLGEPGRLIFSASGLVLCVLWFLGFMLYRPGSRKKSRLGHRQIGVYMGGFLVFFTVCGALLNYADYFNRWFFPVPKIALNKPSSSTEPENLFASVKAVYSEADMERIYFPMTSSEPAMIRFQDGARLYMNPVTLNVIELVRPYSRWVDWLYPVHSGRILGNNRYWLLPVMALTLLSLVIGGVWSVLSGKMGSPGFSRR